LENRNNRTNKNNRFKNNLYTIEDIKYIDGHHKYITNNDGTLFSGPYRTKIKPEDLPEWYMYGRYHKRFGYMSTKGITDLVYIPSRFSNHFLKDDCLLVAYGGKITEKENASAEFSLDRYEGWDERVWGNDIITILCGARKYSGYNIEPFIEKLKWKKEYMQTQFSDEFGADKWDMDVELLFVEALKCPECQMPLRVMHADDCKDGSKEVIGHCEWCHHDWQRRCDKQGWATELERYFHG